MATTAARHRKRQVTSNPWMVNLFEQTLTAEPQVDRPAGIIRDVKVLGTKSRNGHVYSDRAKQDACRILEGAKVNFDHNRSKDPIASERKFIESIGNLRGLYVKPDGVYAREFHVKKSHPNADLLFESAERFPNDFGLSINARGTVNKDHTIVESIKDAQSVDIVGSPATTNGLFESVNNQEPRMIRTSIRKLVESMPASYAKATKIKEACDKMMEDGPSAAVMGAPVDMPDPSDDTGSATPDPMEQLKDAFAALVTDILSNEGLDGVAKKKQINLMVDSMEKLCNPDATTSDAPVKEDDQSDDDSGGGDDMQESVKKQLTAILESVNENNKVTKETSDLTKRNAVSIRLMEAQIEVKPERIDAILGAKDEAAITSLIESWPTKQRVPVAKPHMRAADNDGDEAKMPTGDPKAFAKWARS